MIKIDVFVSVQKMFLGTWNIYVCKETIFLPFIFNFMYQTYIDKHQYHYRPINIF